MSQDDVISEKDIELTIDSEETQKDGEEDNSLGTSQKKKNPSHFKKLAKKAKKLESNWANPEALKARLAELQQSTEDEDFDLDDEDESPEVLTGSEARFFFIENPEAKKYREEMEDLIDENPKLKNLDIQDLYDLAKARFPKSTTKKTIDISSGRTQSDVSKMDLSKMSAEEIAELPLDVYKALRKKK
jgi:hypothetical protein